MKYCKRCLQPDTRPNIYFDPTQICGACLWEDEKKDIDWIAREKELSDIALWAKSFKAKYDCVVGVSGGKDSTFQAIYAKEKLGLKVLLVNGASDSITEIGRKNLANLHSKGFDLITVQPNPIIAKELAVKSFFEEGNVVKAAEYALWASAYIIALQFNIPLVIQGENAALTLGVSEGMSCDGDALGVLRLDTLKGGNTSTLACDNIGENDLYLYNLPAASLLAHDSFRAIWLQYYVKEWSQVANADFSIARGLIGRSDPLHDIGRYRRYTSLDSDLVIANQMIKYLKFGFGFATDEACYDIREKRLTREEAIWLVKEYDGLCGQKYIDCVCSYLGISETEFWQVVDKFVNKNLFGKDDKGTWRPKFTVGEDFEY